jgi:hypothetical protein
MKKGYDNVSFSLKEKSEFITKRTMIYGGKKSKVFTYIYPKESFEIKKEQLFFGATLEVKEINISPDAERTLFTRLDKFFIDNPRHKSVIVCWKKI